MLNHVYTWSHIVQTMSLHETTEWKKGKKNKTKKKLKKIIEFLFVVSFKLEFCIVYYVKRLAADTKIKCRLCIFVFNKWKKWAYFVIFFWKNSSSLSTAEATIDSLLGRNHREYMQLNKQSQFSSFIFCWSINLFPVFHHFIIPKYQICIYEYS